MVVLWVLIMSIVNAGVQRPSVVDEPKDVNSSQADTVSTEVIATSPMFWFLNCCFYVVVVRADDGNSSVLLNVRTV